VVIASEVDTISAEKELGSVQNSCLEEGVKLLAENFDALVEILDGLPDMKGGISSAFTITHGDYRCENIFYHQAEKDKLVVIDFQGAAEGLAEADINYLISGSIPTTLRRDIEKDLLLQYHAAMVAAAVADYPLWQFLCNYQFTSIITLTTCTLGLDICRGSPHERALLLLRAIWDRLTAFCEDWNVIETLKLHLSAPLKLSKEQQIELLPASYRKLLDSEGSK